MCHGLVRSSSLAFNIRCCLVLSLMAGLATEQPAYAQASSSAPLSQDANDQCSYMKKLDAPQLVQLRDSLLVPGKQFDLAALAKDPQLAGFMGDMARQGQVRNAQDWAALCVYKVANMERKIKGAPRVVFLGDSITELWRDGDPAFFSEKISDRGISGQTSSQVLLRFYSDVVELHPAVVHLMVGTNDIAQNTGPISNKDILNNIRAMIDIAQASHIKLVLATIPPAKAFGTQIQSGERIAQLNQQLRRLAAERKLIFVDYYSAMNDGEGGMRAELSNDGIHPNRNGYSRMRPIAEKAIEDALRVRSQ
jgi:lysophospholipase L1-like esterase